MTTHVITGATGLLGTALALELAARTEDRVVCLVRPSATDTVAGRLHSALRRATAAYAPDAPAAPAPARLAAVPVDLRDGDRADDAFREVAARCGGDDIEIWHCAARLAHQPEHRRAIFATNVAGTRRLLRAAETWNTRAFNHVSTAYVAGRRRGLILERPVDAAEPQNLYEASKVAAERAVASATAFPVRILRPSVVIGHSVTHGYAGPYSGAYGIMRRIDTHARLLSGAAQRGRHTRIMLRASATAPFNLIPVDVVVRQAVHLSVAAAPAQIYHLTNPHPPTVGEFLHAVFTSLDLAPPTLVGEASSLTEADRGLERLLDFYVPYLSMDAHFSRRNTDSVLPAPEPAAVLADADTLSAFFAPYAAELGARFARLLARPMAAEAA